MGRAYQNRKESMAKTAGAKTKVYSKYSKEIYVSAKTGGFDPDGNLSLRRLIDGAKKDQVPSHVIKNAIEKAQSGAGEDYERATYEGFAPGGCSVIVDCLTDNNKRTWTDVRNCFMKTDAKIGSPGSAAHMFEHQAVFVFAGEDDEAVLEDLMMADVDVTDVVAEDGKISVFCPHTEFFKAKTAIHESYPELELDVEEVTFVPQVDADIAEEHVERFEKFMAMLDDCDDVQNVYHNGVLPE
ncbi:MAG: YebC/PmpR family DNA-binding transcriptional regulator [Alteromonadales bacterium]|nr:YebC/PmpR family DNA-binding transcriptional regulator [Alteromonadales bacterium]